MIKVSILVPVYNSEKYLRRCFDTLVSQTLDGIEIIVVDDGSTDRSAEILEEYRAAHPDMIKVYRKANGGQGSARNVALDHAEGEFIGCVDSDDSCDPEMFAKMYAAAVRENCDVVACDGYTIRGGSKIYERFDDYPDPTNLLLDALVSPWNKLIARDVYRKSGVRFPEGYIYEDTAWFAELVPFIGRIVTVHEPLYNRYWNPNSTMSSRQGVRTGQIFPVMNGVLDFFAERGIADKYASELEYFYVRILLMSSMMRIALIRHRKLRNYYIKRTFYEIMRHFPRYKKNKYLSGSSPVPFGKRMYLRLASPLLLRPVCFLNRLKCRLTGGV